MPFVLFFCFLIRLAQALLESSSYEAKLKTYSGTYLTQRCCLKYEKIQVSCRNHWFTRLSKAPQVQLTYCLLEHSGASSCLVLGNYYSNLKNRDLYLELQCLLHMYFHVLMFLIQIYMHA